MAIGRALTRKGSKHGFTLSSDSKRNSASVPKTQISAPVALISTTNMISYTSPSLRTSQSYGSMSSSTSSTSGSPTSSKFPSSISSAEDLDQNPHDSLKPSNHLSSYFTTSPVAPPIRPFRSNSVKTPKVTPTATYQRVPSMPPAPISRSNSRKAQVMPPKALHSAGRASVQHPFGAELAQVAEMTEEMGVDVRDAEEEFMISHGLQKFQASDYEQEIWDIGNVFEDHMPEFRAGWI
ncbi:hypothetical protein EDC01DRAFT_21448 [Geopyxis carbonaria]|nr:hypothetical protein EDC01DRAFT_21448 [Geopyxis carbonaria]